MEDIRDNTLALLDDKNGTATLVERKDVTSENFKDVFKRYCTLAKSKGYKIIIGSYGYISRQINLLELLSGVRFEVKDFTALTPDVIPILINHIKLERGAFGEKISKRLMDRRRAGLEIGNPEIARHAKDSAIKQRVRMAIFDEINIKAAKKIFALHKQGETFNAIATELNNQQFVTRRGGSFYAKSVERIYNRYWDLKDNFVSRQSDLEAQAKKISPEPGMVKGLQENYEYNDSFELLLSKKFSIKLYDHKNQEPLNIAAKRLQLNKTEDGWLCSLSISSTRALLPGVHYLVLEDEGQVVFVQSFTIAKSLQDLIDP